MENNALVLSGPGACKNLGWLLQGAKRVAVVTDQNVVGLPSTQAIFSQLSALSVPYVLIDNIPPEPSDADVRRIVAEMGDQQVELFIGIGGGSVLDVTKLLSVLFADNQPGFDALLQGHKPDRRIRMLLAPATAGTGSEGTPNSILAIPARDTKVGIISPVMLPDYVLLDPELTATMPQRVAASTGIDALCHLLECYTANIANPVGDSYCLAGARKILNHIEASIKEADNMVAKLNMLWGSYYGGLAIANAGTHLIHAMSYPLGGKYHIPHGVANAILLVPCMVFIQDVVADKLAVVYDMLPDADTALNTGDKAAAFVQYLERLVKYLQLPATLYEFGVHKNDLPYLVDAALDVQRLMKNVPKTVTRDDVTAIYQTLF